MAYSIPFYPQFASDVFGATAGRTNPHRGQDVAPGGNAFPAWVNGVVVVAGWNSCLGNRVVVKNEADGYFIGVSHLVSIAVSVGQRVSIGDRLGVIGNTGSCSAGRHAHITVSPSSQYPESGPVIDPVAYARTAGGSSTAGAGTYLFTIDTQTKMQQYTAKIGLYTGPADGAMGVNSWSAVMRWLAAVGLYGGPIDGIPGENTYMGLQKVAAQGGYTGPADGVFGPNSEAGLNAWLTDQLKPAPAPAADWPAWQRFLSAYGYTGPADGAPGTNTYLALQKFLSEKFGYTGPIDGDPGDFTWQALALATAAGYPNPAVVTPPVDPPPVVVPPAVKVPDVPAGYMFGVDVGSNQADFNFTVFKAAGGRFVLIKMGGGNASDSPYIAPNYLGGTGQLGKARQAGLLIGHYWMNGNKNGLTPTTSAQYFARHASYMEGDLIALDVEAIDGVPAYTPAEVMEFITEFHTFFPGARFLVYLNRSLLKGSDWTDVVTAGHLLWLATLDGTTAPDLKYWSTATIIQYTIGPVPGISTNVDSNMAVLNLADYAYTRPTPDPVPDPVVPTLTDLVGELKGLIVKYEAK